MAKPVENTLYYGDNLDVLKRYIKDETVDLIYLDPPFKSNQDYNVLFAEQGGTRSAAQIKAFEDTWHWDQGAALAYQQTVEAGGKVSQVMQAFRQFLGENDMLAYLSMMAPRLIELNRVLKDTGSLYLHCDTTASHYLKLLLDSIFKPTNFRNEIVWKRTNAHNDPKRYGRIHDLLLFYQKQPGGYFKEHFNPLPSGHVEERFNKKDARGRYKLENPTGPGPRFGDSGEPWQGFDPTKRNRAWAPPRKLCDKLGIDNSLPTRKKLDALLAAGRVELPSTPGNIPMIKVYLEDVEEDNNGTAYQDIWAYQPYTQGYYYGDATSCVDQDVAWMGPTSGERLGYQTQKPEGLLQRIIRCSCPDGGLVLDPFCGCGTAIAAAQRLNRQWIGIDITHLAITLIKHRLLTAFGKRAHYKVIGEPKDFGGAKELASQDPYQFQWWALGLVGARPAEQKKGADQGIDGRIYFFDEHIDSGRTKQIIFSVKAGHTGPTHLRDLLGVLEREKAQIGVLISLDEPTRAMRTEAAKAGFYERPFGQKEEQKEERYPRLQLLTIEELLKGKGVAYPAFRADLTFKKAPKIEEEKTLSGRLPFGE
jgi:DNA modification methylase